MSFSDPIADMLTRIRNGQQVRLAQIDCPSSKMRKSVLDTLKNEGFIEDYSESEVRKNVKSLKINLKYYNGEPVIKHIKKISKPGRRVFSKITELPKVNNGLGVSILSTSKGIMPDYEAREKNVGGEVICNVF